MIKIIFLGDITGRNARKAINQFLSKHTGHALIAANVENSAGGFGITKKVYDSFLNSGINIMTGGNHIWDKTAVQNERSYFKNLALPCNLPKGAAQNVNPVVHTEYDGVKLSFINLTGRVYMQEDTLDPFTAFDGIYEKECKDRVVIVDFHAEATSEKCAFANYVQTRACAVIGTHTHVQTSDERMIGDTLFITDAGACCSYNSVLGMEIQGSIERCINGQGKITVENKGPVRICGIEMQICRQSKKVVNFLRINEILG